MVTDVVAELSARFTRRFPKTALEEPELKLLSAIVNAEDTAAASTDKSLRASFVEWLCTDAEVQQYIFHRGITLSKAKILDELDLSYAAVPFPLQFVQCAFSACMNLKGTQIPSLHLTGSDVPGIRGDELEVTGSVLLNDGFKAQGEVRLLGAKVGGDLDCSKGEFLNEGGNALFAEGAEVNGDIFLDESFKAHGRVSLVSAEVKGHLQWRGTKNPDSTIMDLRSAHVGFLDDSSDSWPAQGNLYLHGFCYDGIDDNAPASAAERLGWLRRQPTFYPQPYEHLAKILCQSGRDREATKVLIAKQNDHRRRAMPWHLRPLHWLFWLFAGYGYRPWRVLAASLFVIGLSSWFFFAAGRQGMLVPVHGVESDSTTPSLHPVVYALDAFVPLLDLGQDNVWVPKEGTSGILFPFQKVRISGLFLTAWLWTIRVLGWVLTTLFLAALTGIIRRPR